MRILRDIFLYINMILQSKKIFITTYYILQIKRINLYFIIIKLCIMLYYI